MSDLKDFVIKNGVLKEYVGSGGDVIIPAGVSTIGSEAFSDCSSLTSVTIPDGVTEVEWLAFKDCCNLTTVIMPNSVSKIGEGAFDGCASLRRGDGFLIVGDRLISWSGSVKDVVVPDNVRIIENGAFIVCTNIDRKSVV